LYADCVYVMFFGPVEYLLEFGLIVVCISGVGFESLDIERSDDELGGDRALSWVSQRGVEFFLRGVEELRWRRPKVVFIDIVGSLFR